LLLGALRSINSMAQLVLQLLLCSLPAMLLYAAN
jgi:hypothetical protein